MRHRLCASILLLEAVVLGLTTPVLLTLTSVSTATGLVIGLGLAVACVAVAGLLRWRWGYWLGWAIQVAAIVLGVEIAAMIALGVIFLALWATAYQLGGRIERERAAWEATGRPPVAEGQ